MSKMKVGAALKNVMGTRPLTVPPNAQEWARNSLKGKVAGGVIRIQTQDDLVNHLMCLHAIRSLPAFEEATDDVKTAWEEDVGYVEHLCKMDLGLTEGSAEHTTITQLMEALSTQKLRQREETHVIREIFVPIWKAAGEQGTKYLRDRAWP